MLIPRGFDKRPDKTDAVYLRSRRTGGDSLAEG
jgi:hypothetical protein